VAHNVSRLLPLALFFGFLSLYAATAAPGVLSGDSAEFQMAAALLGVPHPTTYPLYTMLGHLAARLVPFGEVAWRVTLLSSLCAAATVALFFTLAWRLLGSRSAALVASIALGLAPGLWNAATLAEVYALLVLLMVGLALSVERWCVERWCIERLGVERRSLNLTHLMAAAFIGGLGFTHHGLFAITMHPILAAAALHTLFITRSTPSNAQHTHAQTSKAQRSTRNARSTNLPTRNAQRINAQRATLLALCFLAGMIPWLYPPLQFLRHGPFDGQDYGLPRFYFWGAPQTLADVLDLMTGGTIRRGIFRVPAPADAYATLQMVGRRVLFEFGPLGTLLGLLGAWRLARRTRWTGRAALWLFFSTLVYLLLLGPAVGDAPVFTLPMLLPWALWIGGGGLLLADILAGLHIAGSHKWVRYGLIILLAALTLAWGGTRYRVSAKQHLTLYGEFGHAVLAALPPNTIVIAHWEQGATLQYLRLVEGQRPDVWVDVVEPGDDPWGARAARRYPGQAVYLVGQPASVAGLSVERVLDTPYADLYRLDE
jgi:hypothetical protein